MVVINGHYTFAQMFYGVTDGTGVTDETMELESNSKSIRFSINIKKNFKTFHMKVLNVSMCHCAFRCGTLVFLFSFPVSHLLLSRSFFFPSLPSLPSLLTQ